MRLDSAMTNHKLRDGWDELLKRRIFNRVSDLKLWRREEIKSYGERSEFQVLSLPNKSINPTENQLFILYTADSSLNVWNPITGTIRTTKINNYCDPENSFFLSTGHLVTWRDNGTFETWDLETNSVRKFNDPKFSVDVSPILLKNDLIAYLHKNKWIKILNPLKEWTCEDTCRSEMRYSINAMFTMTVQRESGGIKDCIIFWSITQIRCWSYEDAGNKSELICGLRYSSVRFENCQALTETHRIVSLNSENLFEVWNLETKGRERAFQTHHYDDDRGFSVLKDERLMAWLPHEESSDILFWNLKSKEDDTIQKTVLTFKHDENINSYSFDLMKSNEIETLVGVDCEGNMYFWNLDNGAVDRFQRPPQVPPYNIPNEDAINNIRGLPEGMIVINTPNAIEIWKPIK